MMKFEKVDNCFLLCSAIFLLIYALNVLQPMSYGDDYLYSFVWDGSNGWNMSQPLPEHAKRVESFADIFESQYSHYFTWGGRVPAHILVQFFLWQGKALFNVANAAIFLLLLLEIAWLSMGGRVTMKIPAKRLAWIFFAVWSFMPGFCPVVTWLTGSCNYLWMTVIVLAFLIPWVRWFRGKSEMKDTPFKSVFMFLGGILCGWTNENTICWLILLLFLAGWEAKKRNELQNWMAWGILGLCIGYACMMAAPGNYVRRALELSVQKDLWEVWKKKMILALPIYTCHFFLWHFIWRAWNYHRNEMEENSRKQWRLVLSFFLLSLGSFFIMFFSPSFPPRAAFGSTIFLIVSGALVLQLEIETKRSHLSNFLKRILFVIGFGYVCITYIYNISNMYDFHVYTRDVDLRAQQAIGTNQGVIIPRWEEQKGLPILIEFHSVGMSLQEDSSHWSNVAYARYWGIPWIRVIEQ